MTDPFSPVDLTVEYVDSVAGSQKTRSAVKMAIIAAKRRGDRTIFAMPTLKLIDQMKAHAKELDSNVMVEEITSQHRPVTGSIDSLICKHIVRYANRGHLLFITHMGFELVADWPVEAKEYDLYIDEVLDVILSRKPFKLRHSHWVLTQWLDALPVPATIPERNKRRKGPPEFTYPVWGNNKKTDQDRLDTCVRIMNPESNASAAEIEMALKEGKRLKAKRDKWEAWVHQGDPTAEDRSIASSYFQIVYKPNLRAKDPYFGLRSRDFAKNVDEVYEMLEPIPRWLRQGNALFTDMATWLAATDKDYDATGISTYRRGLITITGFRRPDALTMFKRVTVLSALFKHTMLYEVWSALGVNFVPSEVVTLAEKITLLDKRKLKIYWLSDEGWSKKARKNAGGITPILQLIKDSGVIDLDQKVCVVVNKDDGTEKQSGTVTAVFDNGIIMPNNVRGRNDWKDEHHQLIHCAALNSYTSDIRWMESVLGIDSHTQRIGRTGQEVYQALMRLSLRVPEAIEDVTLVVMDKDVAEWLVQWFSPIDQVEVIEIDSSGVIKPKGKAGRPRIDTPLSKTERQRRWRAKRRLSTV